MRSLFSQGSLVFSINKSPNLAKPLSFYFSSSPPNPPRKEFKTSSFLKDCSEVTKFKLSTLNTIVGLSTYLMVAPLFSWDTVLFCIATQTMAMSSQGMNQIIEMKMDKLMLRTHNRPLPTQRLSSKHAGLLSFSLFSLSNAIFYLNFPMEALVCANTILLSYILIYTPLKQKSIWNTFVGAVIGGLPPILGWAAAGGSLMCLAPWAVSLYLVAWQFPHFYGILWIYKEDYEKAGYAMISDTAKASRNMKLAFIAKIISVVSLASVNSISVVSGATLIMLLGLYGWSPIKEFQQKPNKTTARRLKMSSYMPFTILFLSIFLNISGIDMDKMVMPDWVNESKWVQSPNDEE